eukprot:482552-Pelagomonas_calceolata.AAC.2
MAAAYPLCHGPSVLCALPRLPRPPRLLSVLRAVCAWPSPTCSTCVCLICYVLCVPGLCPPVLRVSAAFSTCCVLWPLSPPVLHVSTSSATYYIYVPGIHPHVLHAGKLFSISLSSLLSFARHVHVHTGTRHPASHPYLSKACLRLLVWAGVLEDIHKCGQHTIHLQHLQQDCIILQQAAKAGQRPNVMHHLAASI